MDTPQDPEPSGTAPAAENGPVAPPPPAERAPLGVFAGLLVAWLLLALADAVFIAAALPMPRGGAGVRALHHLLDFGQLLGVGLACAGLAWLGDRALPRRPAVRLAAVAVTALALGAVILPDDLSGLADKLFSPLWLSRGLVVFAASLSVPFGAAAGGLCARRLWSAALGAAAGLGLGVANLLVLAGDYPALHAFVAWTAAMLAGVSLHRLPRPRLLSPSRALRGALAAAAIAAACSFLAWPGSAVVVELFKVPGAVAAPLYVALRSHDGAGGVLLDMPAEWMRDRAGAPAIPATTPALLPADGVAILLVVDCMRGDLLTEPKYVEALPNLRRLRDENLHFRDARSLAPATTQSVAALYRSRFYSQIYWTLATIGNDPRLYPIEDQSPTFPGLLAEAGVHTASVTGLSGLVNKHGVVRGIQEENIVSTDAAGLVARTLTVLDGHAGERRFVYLHAADAHAPYGKGKGTPFEKYRRQIGEIDAAIGKLRAGLEERGLWDKAALIVTADHGEAFGEHNDTTHAHTVYDELLHVPFVVHVPGAAPRVVDTPVSAADLGPTLLDLFGAPTPGTFMGQSLVGFARGQTPVLTRPVVAEGARRMQAMVFPDGTKVILDRTRKTVEIFDLRKDPGELDNLADALGGPLEPHAATARAYFDAHELRRPGYSTPYQKW